MISFSDHSYNLLVVGDKGVGKTLFSTVDGILNSEEWKIDYVGYKERKKEINLNGERIKLTIESFQNLNKWSRDISYYGDKHVTKLVIANKCDLAEQKVVNFNKATEYFIRSNISMFEVSAQDSTNVELAYKHMILKLQSNLTSRINHQPDQYSKQIDLEFVYHISNIDPNVAEQNVDNQGLHVGTENENEQISIEKKAMQSNVINLSKTFESFCIEKVNELKYLLKLYNVTFNLTITMC
ncbi:unnamed protein product [Adineta steineri]|uniref:Uncharacterized protein n=1 Tax=Adineta steineri TaxID=433720 RepID=A0A815CBK4_9BILA|nr:unnamed protein product [Adineta steineri]CAF1540471.1 unnamed protein product [Adineta steineri]